MTVEEFEEKVRQDCDALGVKLEISPKSYVLDDEGGKCNGYFDDAAIPPKLAYAKGQPEENWVLLVIHEYNHMCQWVELSEIWHGVEMKEADEYFWKWLDGKVKLTPEKLRSYAMAYLRVELDCERRAIAMIEDLNLPVDINLYCQKANAYVLFYHLILKHRKWSEVGMESYNIPEIVSQMPEDLHTLNYEEISDEMVTLFETHMSYLLDSPSS